MLITHNDVLFVVHFLIEIVYFRSESAKLDVIKT